MQNPIGIQFSEKELNRLIRVFSDTSEARQKTANEKEYKQIQTKENKAKYLKSLDDYLLLKKLRESKPKKPKRADNTNTPKT